MRNLNNNHPEILIVAPDRILVVRSRRFGSKLTHTLYLNFSELRRLKNKSRKHYVVSVKPMKYSFSALSEK